MFPELKYSTRKLSTEPAVFKYNITCFLVEGESILASKVYGDTPFYECIENFAYSLQGTGTKPLILYQDRGAFFSQNLYRTRNFANKFLFLHCTPYIERWPKAENFIKKVILK